MSVGMVTAIRRRVAVRRMESCVVVNTRHVVVNPGRVVVRHVVVMITVVATVMPVPVIRHGRSGAKG